MHLYLCLCLTFICHAFCTYKRVWKWIYINVYSKSFERRSSKRTITLVYIDCCHVFLSRVSSLNFIPFECISILLRRHSTFFLCPSPLWELSPVHVKWLSFRVALEGLWGPHSAKCRGCVSGKSGDGGWFCKPDGAKLIDLMNLESGGWSTEVKEESCEEGWTWELNRRCERTNESRQRQHRGRWWTLVE